MDSWVMQQRDAAWQIHITYYHLVHDNPHEAPPRLDGLMTRLAAFYSSSTQLKSPPSPPLYHFFYIPYQLSCLLIYFKSEEGGSFFFYC